MVLDSIHVYLKTYYIHNSRGFVADYSIMFEEWITNTTKSLNKA